MAVVGFVDEQLDLYNAAAVCCAGEVRGVYHKQELPNYGVFDEQRYFAAGRGATQLFGIGGVRVGVSVCEDAWNPSGPIAAQAAAGAELVININASPYYLDRLAEREQMLATRAADASCGLVYLNCVGGQDELVFDGASLVFDAAGRLVASLPQFSEELTVVDIDVRPVFRKRLLDPRGHHLAPAAARDRGDAEPRQAPDAPRLPAPKAARLATEAEVYQALVTGTRDYVRKNGFHDVVIGLSGGIDSSLVAVVAADALGPEHVHGVSMPSRYSSDGSSSDAAALAANLGIDYRTVPIEPAHTAFLDMLAPDFEGLPPGLTEENLQSRIRGVILMALSNKLGWLVLTTGNKSEVAVGYSTLYGDTAGGFAVIKDVTKTLVYRLCAWRNQPGRGAGHPRGGADQAAVGRAAPRPAGRPEPAALRRARSGPAGLRRGRPHRLGTGRGRLRRGAGAPGGPPGRPGRVQAPPDAAGRAGHAEGVRPGPPDADHQPLPVTASDARVSHRPRMRRVTATSATEDVPVRRSRSRRGQGEQLRDEILAAAERILIETNDQAALSIRAIAAAVGVTPPSIYLHFADRNDLVFAVCERHGDTPRAGHGRRRRGRRRSVGAHPAPGLRLPAMGARQSRALPDPDDEPARPHPRAPAGRAAGRHGRAGSRRRGHRRGGGRRGQVAVEGDPMETIKVLWMMIHGMVSLLISKPEFPFGPVDEVYERMLDLVFRGLAPRT